jgi:hypothetical protein
MGNTPPTSLFDNSSYRGMMGNIACDVVLEALSRSLDDPSGSTHRRRHDDGSGSGSGSAPPRGPAAASAPAYPAFHARTARQSMGGDAAAAADADAAADAAADATTSLEQQLRDRARLDIVATPPHDERVTCRMCEERVVNTSMACGHTCCGTCALRYWSTTLGRPRDAMPCSVCRQPSRRVRPVFF